MHVLGIVGSPRHGKNTASLVQAVLNGVASQGMMTELYYLHDYHIGACTGCEECKETQVCVLGDDMRLFYTAIDRCRGLVLGTPVYFDHVSAQTKLFLDRLYAYLGPNLENHFPKGVKAVLLVTWGASKPDMYDYVIEYLAQTLWNYYRVETVASLKAANLERYPTDKKEALYQEAFAAGVRLAESLHKR